MVTPDTNGLETQLSHAKTQVGKQKMFAFNLSKSSVWTPNFFKCFKITDFQRLILSVGDSKANLQIGTIKRILVENEMWFTMKGNKITLYGR